MLGEVEPRVLHWAVSQLLLRELLILIWNCSLVLQFGLELTILCLIFRSSWDCRHALSCPDRIFRTCLARHSHIPLVYPNMGLLFTHAMETEILCMLFFGAEVGVRGKHHMAVKGLEEHLTDSQHKSHGVSNTKRRREQNTVI